jgi:hypothetical protein
MITKLKKALDCKTNSELVKKMEATPLIKNGDVAYIKIHRSQLTRWDKNGFPLSFELILNLLLEKIDGEIKT